MDIEPIWENSKLFTLQEREGQRNYVEHDNSQDMDDREFEIPYAHVKRGGYVMASWSKGGAEENERKKSYAIFSKNDPFLEGNSSNRHIFKDDKPQFAKITYVRDLTQDSFVFWRVYMKDMNDKWESEPCFESPDSVPFNLNPDRFAE